MLRGVQTAGLGSLPPLSNEWTDDAACLGANPEMFFPERGEHQKDDQAMNTCAACPVRIPCLDASMNEHLGVWGGWRAEHRVIVRRQGHDCPWCGWPIDRYTARLFCSDPCRDAAVESVGDTRAEVDARIQTLADQAAEWNRARRPTNQLVNAA